MRIEEDISEEFIITLTKQNKSPTISNSSYSVSWNSRKELFIHDVHLTAALQTNEIEVFQARWTIDSIYQAPYRVTMFGKHNITMIQSGRNPIVELMMESILFPENVSHRSPSFLDVITLKRSISNRDKKFLLRSQYIHHY